ncbi:ABC transporter permease [soil metagenome]
MISDLKYALRTLAKRPGFTAVAIITLALGIGASTAIFSVLEAVLLRPFPYPQQERLVEVHELNQAGRAMRFADPNFDDLRERSRSFDAIASYSGGAEAVAGGVEPVRTDVLAVTADYFRVLGVAPVIGRFFGEQGDGQGGQVAVVSYAFWKGQLQGQTDLSATALRFGNRSFAVIGVLPAGTEFPPGTDVFCQRGGVYPRNESRTGHSARVIGRLRAGIALEQAATEVGAIGRQLKAEHGTQIDAVSFGISPLRERLVKDVRGILLVLCGAVGLLLAIACSNVANLLLVRASARRKEVALRAALGASRAQLARQFIAESLLLTLIAGALGVLLAVWGVDLIVGFYRGNLPRVGDIGVNTSVLLFALAVSVMVGFVLGLVPTLQTSRHQLQNDLQDAGRGTAGPGRTRVRNFLIIAQVALTVMLLVGAGLLGRSFHRLTEVDPGFQPESAVAMTVSMPFPEDTAAHRQLSQFYHQLLERIQALAGVSAAGGTNGLPMGDSGANGTFLVQGGGRPAETLEELNAQYHSLSEEERARDAEFRVASGGYFAAMGIPLVSGRVFQESDGADAPHVAVVSQSLARRYFPNEEAIGKQIQFGNMDGDLRLLNIVGIVGDVRDTGLDVDVRPTVYVHYLQRPRHAAEFSIVVRGRGDAAGLISAMRQEGRALNPEMPLRFEPLRQLVSASLDSRRFSMVMLGVFAGTALVLAMVGLYGVMAYITAERTTELGIRMALGAQRGDMLRLVLQQSFTLVSIGVVVGIAGALAATRVLASLLHGVGAADLATFSAVVILLGVAALIASYIPARRAMNVDPMVALRHE